MFEVSQALDSFELLSQLAPLGAAYDVVITDPPYDEHNHKNAHGGPAAEERVPGHVPRSAPAFDPLTDYGFTLNLAKIARRWALTFCTLEAFGTLRTLHGSAYRRGAVWYKPNSMGQLTHDRPAACYEGIGCLHLEPKARWNGGGSYGLWVANGTRGEKGRHPNQKPLDLCLKLVALFSDRGETVFDPFCGSARIGEACMLLGRNYVGRDQDPLWCERARARLSRVLSIGAWGAVPDAEALGLCRAKKSDMLETEDGPL